MNSCKEIAQPNTSLLFFNRAILFFHRDGIKTNTTKRFINRDNRKMYRGDLFFQGNETESYRTTRLTYRANSKIRRVDQKLHTDSLSVNRALVFLKSDQIRFEGEFKFIYRANFRVSEEIKETTANKKFKTYSQAYATKSTQLTVRADRF